MSLQCLVALVGDYNPAVPAHQVIPIALNLAAAHYRMSIKATWIPTSLIQRAEDELASYHCIWCVSASPYENAIDGEGMLVAAGNVAPTGTTGNIVVAPI